MTNTSTLFKPLRLVFQVMTQRQNLAGIAIPGGYPDATVEALKHAVHLSFLSGFRWVMPASAALALASSGSAWVFMAGKQTVGEAVHATKHG